MTDGSEYRGLSLWLDTVDDDLSPRPSLDGDAGADVAIVGAGFTGLWTGYALLRQAPHLRVLVVERDIAGFGASGRNGGWASDLFPVSWERVARVGGSPGAAVALHRAMVEGIDDIEATLARES
ncbi:MAG: FAD-binding oxidoreductase, partial [Candidatus Dormibacteraeota bacterium]|nr:FAD-binding oxidoreductase [Candidatus Dormibacteraeota bacterium]